MGQKEIVISRSAEDFLKSLVQTLYDEEYFGFVESAEEYVNRIYGTIYNDLPNLTHHRSYSDMAIITSS